MHLKTCMHARMHACLHVPACMGAWVPPQNLQPASLCGRSMACRTLRILGGRAQCYLPFTVLCRAGLRFAVQHQNSNLTEEFSILLSDLGPAPLAWAAEVFGGPPEASNMWVGDERSVTSFHKGKWRGVEWSGVGRSVGSASGIQPGRHPCAHAQAAGFAACGTHRRSHACTVP